MKAVSKTSIPVALTIAGFDPSGGAGILADARTFGAFGFAAAAVATSLTFQNEREFLGAVHQTAETVRAQVEPLLKTTAFACAKTGMLPTREVVNEVARLFQHEGLPAPVVDPVLMSSSGRRLMDDDAIEGLIDQLFPLSRLVTPNIPEAERLSGLQINSEAEMQKAAARIRRLGARAVLVKGGHLRDEAATLPEVDQETLEGRYSKTTTDVLDDDGQVTVFREERVVGVEMHGSGCRLSAAIAAGLGNGISLEKAVAQAKHFVTAEFRRLSVSARQA